MLRFWWIFLVTYWIIFPTPIHMLHSDLRCENHTTSKIEYSHKISAYNCILDWVPTSATCKPHWKTAEKSCGKKVEICWKIPFRKLKFSSAESALILTISPMFQKSKQLISSAAHRLSDPLSTTHRQSNLLYFSTCWICSHLGSRNGRRSIHSLHPM